MANIAIFRINYKSDFILTLNSDAGWMTPFCIKFWTGAPSQAYFAGYDGTTYTHCAPVAGEPTKLLVQFDDHHLPIGDLKFQIGYHFTVADFPTSVEDEVINQASVIIEVDNAPAQVMLDFNGETAPEIEFSLPAYANEAQRIENEQQRIENEQQRIDNEQQRIENEQTRQRNEGTRIENEQERVQEFGQMKGDLEQATRDAAAAAENANEKGVYAKNQGDYAKQQGDYAKQQGDTAKADHERAEEDHRIAGEDHTQAGSDHTRAGEDHTQAGSDHTRAGEDHTRAGDDHTRADQDHTRAESDHAAVEVYVDSLGAFDISAYHATGGVLAKYADLTAALGTNGANIPDALRKGGMSVKFVQSSDNKYVQYFLTKDEWSVSAGDWEKINLENEVDTIGEFMGISSSSVSSSGEAPDHSYVLNNGSVMYINNAINGKICYFPIEKDKVYNIHVPKTLAACSVVLYSNTIGTTHGASGFVQIQGGGNNSSAEVKFKALDYKYVAVVYYLGSDSPTCVETGSDLVEDIKEDVEELKVNVQALGQEAINVSGKVNLINSFVGASKEATSIQSYADDHSYILYSNFALYVNQAFNTRVCYFPIEKYSKYHIDIPKTGNSAMAIACFCGSVITSGGRFSKIKDINSQEIGAGNDGAFNFDYIAEYDGYLAITYNTTANIPTCICTKSVLANRVSELESKQEESKIFDYNDVYDVTNYALFVSIIENKKYDSAGMLTSDSGYNSTTPTFLDKEHDTVICINDNNNRMVFFDKNMNFISYIDGVSFVNKISKSDYPQNAVYVAFSFKNTLGDFSTRNEIAGWIGYNQTAKSSIKKLKGSRPKLFIYTTDTETEIMYKLIDAYLTKDCDVIWESGTYTFEDIFVDMVDEYSIGRVQGSWQRELPIGGNCRYYFNGSTIIGNMPSTLTDAKIFGTMRGNIDNYELRDVTLISNDMVYCVHDEGSAANGSYIHSYINCKMVANKTTKAVRCIGAGTGKHGVAIIDNCVFEGVDNVTDVAYHGITDSSVTDDCEFAVNVKNSYFKLGVQVNTLATNQQGKLVYCGNSASVAPSVTNGWTSVQWNNELRS